MAVVVREVLGDCRVAVFLRRDKCEVHTRGNDVVSACLTPVSVWRDMLKKQSNN